MANILGKKKQEYSWGTGRRKTSVARVRVCEGTGQFIINDVAAEKFVKVAPDRERLLAPLKTTKNEKRLDIFVSTYGGGNVSQIGAIIMGLARALCNLDESNEQPLRDQGFMTRDARMKERKKFGRRGARRGCQFSKR